MSPALRHSRKKMTWCLVRTVVDRSTRRLRSATSPVVQTFVPNHAD